MAAYPIPGTEGVNNLFLAYTGYSLDSKSLGHFQYWETADFKPIITHINRSTGQADNELFTDFLFLAISIKNPSGVIKYIVRNDSRPANMTDWQTYINELFAAGKNLSALYTASHYNGLGRQIKPNVWIALPYPHPKIFTSDYLRLSAVTTWIDLFIKTWIFCGYYKGLVLRGFYWIQECEYYHGPLFYDSYIMSQVNKYIHKKFVNNQQLKALWIPYQKAAGWEQWKTFGFDLAILQPSYYFDQTKSLEAGAADAYANCQGVEMEMDLAVTRDRMKRARFIEYMDKGAAGGYDSTGRYFGPYMNQSTLGWYVGGWYWNNGVRNQAILTLYNSGDSLYDSIWEFVKGSYKAGTAYPTGVFSHNHSGLSR